VTMRDSFFQRFQSDDPVALARKVEQDYQELARAEHDEQMQLEILSRLGPRLTILGREQAAAPLLEQALVLARQFGEQRLEASNLLNLATAQQYLGKRDLAQDLFQEALDKARAYAQDEYEDFILHHRGRCYVEQGKRAEARACFELALALRRKKGDQRGIDSTQRALDALRVLP
jgi:HTH-type transcriptional regulator, pleiotropic regulator of extracellular virulence genes